jgi:penicillin-binding protein 1A
LTTRGVYILVGVERLLDEAGRAGKTSSNDQKQPAKPVTSGALAFPENYVAAAGEQAPPAGRKN